MKSAFAAGENFVLKKNLCLLALAITLLPCVAVKGQTAADIVVERNVAMQTRDGVTLRADIYRPAAEGNYPVLLTRTPYNKDRSEEHTSELQSLRHLVCRLLLEK